MEIPKEYREDEGLRTLANFLRSDNGVKIYKAVEHEKRVEYFKGKAFIDTLLNIGLEVDPKKAKKWPKSIPKITDKAVAIGVGNALLNKNFFHRSDKAEVKKGSERILTVSPVQIFEEAGVYTWIYQGGMLFRYIMSGYVAFPIFFLCSVLFGSVLILNTRLHSQRPDRRRHRIHASPHLARCRQEGSLVHFSDGAHCHVSIMPHTLRALSSALDP